MVLNETAILYRLLVKKDLVVTPILDLSQQLGSSTLDVRLGTRFLAQKSSSLIYLDPLRQAAQIEADKLQYEVEYTLQSTQAYVLHPGEFVLASTLEYVVIPADLTARLDGRSSWGRAGLEVHATAGFVASGFEGTITFELKNVSRMPIPLYPMLRVAQLSFYEIGPNTRLPYRAKASSKYAGYLAPTGSTFYRDPEWDIIRKELAAQGKHQRSERLSAALEARPADRRPGESATT
ncbi:MAG: dCTP deaminase [Chloroflexi bacterium]|nr:dCTP deaminase [Chloroflexota bacterium]